MGTTVPQDSGNAPPADAEGASAPAAPTDAPTADAGDGMAAGTAIATQAPQTATAVARANLSEATQVELARKREVAYVANQIASMSWGKELDADQRKAIALWGDRNGVDIETEVHILGGNFYLNARYYINRAQPFLVAGILEYIKADNISPDARLDEMANRRPEDDDDPETAALVRKAARWADTERYRREMLRIEFKVPEDAEVAFVGRVKFAHLAQEVVGCKWWVPDVVIKFKNGSSKQKDPVSDSGYAVETVETRALRRALRLCVGKLPAGDPFRVMVERTRDETMPLAQVMAEAKARSVMEDAQRRRDTFHGGLLRADGAYEAVTGPRDVLSLPAGGADAPKHGDWTAPTVVAERLPVSPETMARVRAQADPYGHPDAAPGPMAEAERIVSSPAPTAPPADPAPDPVGEAFK